MTGNPECKHDNPERKYCYVIPKYQHDTGLTFDVFCKDCGAEISDEEHAEWYKNKFLKKEKNERAS
jgi:hypothetical protein